MTATKSILVYAYGCAAPLVGREYLEREHARCVAFWDQLVTIDAAIEGETIARAAADVPAIAAASARIDALSVILAADPDATGVRAERRALYSERKALLKDWRRGQREWLRELERKRIATVVAARQAVSSLSLRPIDEALEVERKRLGTLLREGAQ